MSDARLAIQGGRPAIDPARPFPTWPSGSEADVEAMRRVLFSGAWGSNAGREVHGFEHEFAALQDADHAVATVNGTMAIVAALHAVGVGLGDHVIVPSYTFIATASAALMLGAIPIFADVRADDHLIDIHSVRHLITSRTKAVIAVHLAGAAADLDGLRSLCSEHGIALIEDAAQAVGAEYRGRRVGAIGDVGTFSFQSSKNLTAGEGGMMVTNRADIADTLYSFVNVGRVPGGGWYEHRFVGYNLRMTEFQAALLHEQLQRFDPLQANREHAAQALDAHLTSISGLVLNPTPDGVTRHGRHLYLTRVPQLGAAGLRDVAVAALKAEGVGGAFTGYVPLHRSPVLLDSRDRIAEQTGQRLRSPECPVTDVLCSDTIWLDQRTLLGDDEQIAGVASAFEKVLTSEKNLITVREMMAEEST